MQSSHILYIAQALESMFFYMCFKILYSFKMFFKMSFHAAMMLICPLFTGDSQITTTLCPTTSQEGAWSRFWWLTQYCYVGTQVMTLSTISHMDPWTWIKLTTSWPGSLRAWKTAGTPGQILLFQLIVCILCSYFVYEHRNDSCADCSMEHVSLVWWDTLYFQPSGLLSWSASQVVT